MVCEASAKTHPNHRHSSIKQIKEEERLQARIKNGLDSKPSDIKDVYNDPTTSYVENPPAKSKSEWVKKIKAENVRLLWDENRETKNI